MERHQDQIQWLLGRGQLIEYVAIASIVCVCFTQANDNESQANA
jgi:hypothetical protein